MRMVLIRRFVMSIGYCVFFGYLMSCSGCCMLCVEWIKNLLCLFVVFCICVWVIIIISRVMFWILKGRVILKGFGCICSFGLRILVFKVRRWLLLVWV